MKKLRTRPIGRHAEQDKVQSVKVRPEERVPRSTCEAERTPSGCLQASDRQHDRGWH